MLVVPPAFLERLGDDLCRRLQARGYRPDWVGFNDDQMLAIRFDFAPQGELPWRKAFSKQPAEATVEAFEADIDEWRAGIVRDIRAGTPSQTVQDAIAHFGEGAVLVMMGAVQ